MNGALLNEIGLSGETLEIPEQIIDPVSTKTLDDYLTPQTIKYLTLINTLLWAAYFMGWLK